MKETSKDPIKLDQTSPETEAKDSRATDSWTEEKEKELEALRAKQEQWDEERARLENGYSENPFNPYILRRPGLPSIMRQRESRPDVGDSSHRSDKTKRNPFSNKGALNYPPRPGYHRAFLNMTPGEVEDKLRLGYDFARTNAKADQDGKPGRASQMGSHIERVVNPKTDGTKGVLMEIPLDKFEEYMKEQNEIVDSTEKGIYQNLEDFKRIGPAGATFGEIKITR